ncbi:uncharacterized protein LOC115882550 [Sitophilus oryzae]|uniref:Uncharacterized protein LOC115882550 n=1 Tax=Sitophilus oryzae TaxID=7048 RepID=A0A6J2Y0L0_SITOR|nr:uncharacterized protein LOC115882550 [Sitophilus oryzae]
MCNTNQLRTAFQNVSFCADTTWSVDQGPFQRANMGLYLKERQAQFKASRWERISPRTVRDCIPESKLARYANFEYDEARELSYTPAVTRYERLYQTFSGEEVNEPWMLEEIDDLLIGFLCYKEHKEDTDSCNENHDNLPCNNGFCELSYESPFLNASTFEEMALKLKIKCQSTKMIWDVKCFPYFGWQPLTRIKNLDLFKSPISQFFASESSGTNDACSWTRVPANDYSTVTHLEDLAQGFKQPNEAILKKNKASSWLETNTEETNDLSPHKRLYSAVLQGTSHTAGPSQRSTSVQFSTSKLLEASSTTDSFTETPSRPPHTTTENFQKVATESYWYQSQNYQYYHAKTSTQPPVFTGYQYLPQNIGAGFYSRPLFVPNPGLLSFRHTAYFPHLVLQNPAPYPPPTFLGYSRPVVLPQRPQVVLPPSSWFIQQSMKASVGFLTNRNHPQTSSYQYRPPKPKPPPLPLKSVESPSVMQDLENIVAKTVGAILDDQDEIVPVANSVSDDLELQALEQYSPSSDNVFSELERQATEQYETPENWTSPPKGNSTAFGGFGALLRRLRCAGSGLLVCRSKIFEYSWISTCFFLFF